MDVLISLHVPDGTGRDYEAIAVLEDVDGGSQLEALAEALLRLEAFGWDDGLVAGVRLAASPELLPGERLVDGGLEAAAELLEGRRAAEAPRLR